MFRRKPVLPDVPIYGFIGGIPETFGGRTGVCLQRAQAFAELDNRRMEILTLSPSHGIEPEALTRRLRQEGRIGEKVTIRNIWADLRRASDDDLRQIAGHGSVPVEIRPDELLDFEGSFDREDRSETDKLLQTDRFRADGTHVVSYRQPIVIDDQLRPRRAVLFDTRGRPLAQWEQQYQLYFAWLDWIIGTDPAVIINDGPPLARYMHEYRRSNVVFVQTIHSRHSSAPGSPQGLLAQVYVPTFLYMDEFDRVAILTQSQQDDILRQHLAVDNTRVLPNMVVAERVKRIRPRDPASGVILARTAFQKRIDHAIRAVHLAQQTGVSARLDVYGVADEAEDSLRELITTLGVQDTIALRGFNPRAKEKFAEASFTLLTSQYEGLSLALLEAMSAGCIPIAYDVKYGAADTIVDGVNGFLVPSGDIEAMSERVRLLASMSDRELRKMRKAAVLTSLDYTPLAITRRWGEVLTEALETKIPVVDIDGRATLTSLVVKNDAIVVKATISGEAAREPEWVMLTWAMRKGAGFGRTPATVRPDGENLLVKATLKFEEFSAVQAGDIDFWFDLCVSGSPVRLRVAGARKGLPLRHDVFEFYATRYRKLSLTVARDATNP